MPDAVRIFHRLDAAENARVALIAAGFPASAVDLATRVDEAGALQGNFVAGNPKQGSAADGNYDDNYAHVVPASTYLLAVKAGDDVRFGEAMALMAQLGGRDIDAPAPPSSAPS